MQNEASVYEKDGKIELRSSSMKTQNIDMEKTNGVEFVEKTIGTILSMHEKVLSAKDETVTTLKSENSFLKEALISMQEIYEEDRKTIQVLNEQLQISQQDLDHAKKKYRLMWNKVLENASNEKHAS
ncbi:MAG: DUF3972 domain-containing protein [Campylobacterota bacterium]